MLPDVNRQQRLVSWVQVGWSVLVLCLPVFQDLGILVVDEPSPARSLKSGGMLVEVVLEVLS